MTVQIWDANKGHVFLTYQGHTQPVNAVAWSPDGKRIASVSENVQLWDASSGKRFYAIENQSGAPLSNVVAWSPDGLYLVTSPAQQSDLFIHNAATGDIIFDYGGQGAYAVAWSPNGQLIASGLTNIDVWKLVNNASAVTLYTYHGHSDYVNRIAWSPDGKRIASASGSVPTGTTDNTVQVFDASTGNNAYTYTGHSGPVTGVTWSPDGKYLSSSSVDKTVQIWRTP